MGSGAKKVTHAVTKVAGVALAPVTGGASLKASSDAEKAEKRRRAAEEERKAQRQAELDAENRRLAKEADLAARKQRKGGIAALVGEDEGSQMLG